MIEYNVQFEKIFSKILILFFFLITTTNLNSQVTWNYESLTRGKLWETIWNSLQYGEPNNLFSSPLFTINYPGYSKGSSAYDALNYTEATGFCIYGQRNSIPAAYTINTRFKPSSRYVYATEEAIKIKNYNLLDPTEKAEEIVTGAQHINDLIVDVSHKSMAWSFPGYSDFIIHEITIFNSHYTTLEEMYFGLRYGIRMTERSRTDYDEKYGWDAEEEVFYFYDHRSFNWEDESLIEFNFGVGPLRGDLGDSRDIYEAGSREHELDAPGYFTALCLDSEGKEVYLNILEHLGGDFTTEAPLEDQMFRLDQLEVVGPDRLKDVMTHQQPRLSWDDARLAGGEGGNKFERKPEFLVSAGPYTIAPYNSITLVFAEVVGEMDREKIVEGGVENIDLLEIESKAALLNNVKTVKEFYSNNYIPSVYPPMTVTDGENSLTLETEPGLIKISWPEFPSYYQDPLTGTNDFVGYRVYRSSYFTIGPWKLIADIPQESAMFDEEGNVYYVDQDVAYGVGNYYCVTTYDSDGNESGKVNNNRYPIYPIREANEEFPKNVYVVPNPFRQHSGLLGTGERYRIEFIGIPSKCSIKIYTITGALVQEIEHDDGSGSEAWGSIKKLDYQLSKWLLQVAPGIYVYRVESKVSGREGEYFIGKFAILK